MEDAHQSPLVSSSSSEFERLSSGDGSKEDPVVPGSMTDEEEDEGALGSGEAQPSAPMASLLDFSEGAGDAPSLPKSAAWEPLKPDVAPAKPVLPTQAAVKVPDQPAYGILHQDKEPDPKPRAAPVASETTQVTSSSADETLSPPAASTPLMHASAESLVDFKKQPNITEPTVKEDVASTLPETAAPLSPLSSLSDDSLEEQISLSASLPTVDLSQKTGSTLEEEPTQSSGGYTELTEGLKCEILEIPCGSEGDKEKRETEPGHTASPTTELVVLEQVSNEKGVLENTSEGSSDLEKDLKQGSVHLPQMESISEKFSLMDEEWSKQISDTVISDSNEKKWADTEQGSVLTKSELPGEQNKTYGTEIKNVVWDSAIVTESCGVTENKMPGFDELNFQTEKDSGQPAVKLEDTLVLESTSATPEIHLKESPQAYVTFATFEPSTSFGDSLKDLSPLVAETPGAKLKDEFKAEQIDAAPSIVMASSEPFFSVEQAAVTPDSLSKSSADSSSNVSEIPTPDVVQGAHEGDLHDVIYLKNTDESTVDLVQTLSEPSKDTLSPTVMLPPSPEGSDSAQSPVLPDIIMESPSNVSTCRMETSASAQVESVDYFTEVTAQQDAEIIQESNKFAVIDEKLSVPLSGVQGASVGGTPADVTSLHEATYVQDTNEETETPYMSVSCDLIKETKTTKETVSSEVTDHAVPLPTKIVTEQTSKFVDLSEGILLGSEQSDVPVGQKVSDIIQSKDMPQSLTPYTVEKPTAVVTPSPEHTSREMVMESPVTETAASVEFFQLPIEASKDAASCMVEEPFVGSAEMESLTANLAEALEEPVLMTDTREEFSKVYAEPKVPETVPFDHEPSTAAVQDDGFGTLISTTFDKSPVETMEHEITQTVVHEETVRDFVEAEKTIELSHAAVQDRTSHLPSMDIHEVKEQKSTKLLDELATAPVTLKKEKLEELSEVPFLLQDAVASHAAAKETFITEKAEASEKDAKPDLPSSAEGRETLKDTAATSLLAKLSKTEVVDLLYWRDIKKTGVVFGVVLFLLLSLTIFSIVSVTAYIALALLSMTVSFRIYKGVLQAIQKSDEGHPFKACLERDVTLSQDLVHNYSDTILSHVNCTVKELRRLFLVEDLVDSLKFAVLMWLLTYVGALFNGLTLLILALISLFSVPVIYERHQTQIDHYVGLVSKQVKDALAKVQAKIPYLKRKTE